MLAARPGAAAQRGERIEILGRQGPGGAADPDAQDGSQELPSCDVLAHAG